MAFYLTGFRVHVSMTGGMVRLRSSDVAMLGGGGRALKAL